MAALDKLNKVPLGLKVVILIVVLVAVVAGFHFTTWTKLDEEIQRLEVEQVKLQRQYDEQKAVADNLPTFQENTRKLEEDLSNALKLLPREKEIPSLLRDIYTLGRKSGVEFKSFEPQKEVARQLYAEIPVKMQITGSYHEIAVFFDRIGKMSRIVNVSGLDMNASRSDKESETQLTVNCMAVTFMFVGGPR